MIQSWLQIGQASAFTPNACIGQLPIVCLDSTGENHCEFYTFLVRYMKYSCSSSFLQLSTGKSLKLLSSHDFHEVEGLHCLKSGEIMSLYSNLYGDTVTEENADPGFQQLKCFL